MELYLSRMSSGLYLMTALKPVIKKIAGRDIEDVYIQAGEPVGVAGLCPWGIQQLFNVKLDRLETIKVKISGCER